MFYNFSNVRPYFLFLEFIAKSQVIFLQFLIFFVSPLVQFLSIFILFYFRQLLFYILNLFLLCLLNSSVIVFYTVSVFSSSAFLFSQLLWGFLSDIHSNTDLYWSVTATNRPVGHTLHYLFFVSFDIIFRNFLIYTTRSDKNLASCDF